MDLPVLAHGGRLGPRLGPALLWLPLTRLRLHPLLDRARPQRHRLVSKLVAGGTLGALGSLGGTHSASRVFHRGGCVVPIHVWVELPVELQRVAHFWSSCEEHFQIITSNLLTEDLASRDQMPILPPTTRENAHSETDGLGAKDIGGALR